MSTITIKYTCPKCGLTDQQLAVPERQRAVDVVLWMNGPVAKHVAQDHAERSPHCQWENFDLRIPVPGGVTMIGRKSE